MHQPVIIIPINPRSELNEDIINVATANKRINTYPSLCIIFDQFLEFMILPYLLKTTNARLNPWFKF
jgi:hypothetical protein